MVPPPTSEYRVQHGQVHVPASAAQRKGIQPVVHLEVNGAERAEVAVGEAVTLTARIEVPPPGKVVSATWDFEGVGTYPDAAELGDPTSQTVHVTTTRASPNRAPTSRRYASPPNVRATPARHSRAR